MALANPLIRLLSIGFRFPNGMRRRFVVFVPVQGVDMSVNIGKLFRDCFGPHYVVVVAMDDNQGVSVADQTLVLIER